MTEIPNQSFRMPGSDAAKYLEQASGQMKLGNYQEAIPLYETALATLERVHGPDQPELAECLQFLGEAYEAAYRLDDALTIHTRLLRMGEKILGRANPNVVAMLLKLSQVCEMLGRQNDALSYCQQALESAKQCLAQDDPLSQHIIERFNQLAEIVQMQARAQQQPEQHQAQPGSSQMSQPDWQSEIPLNDRDMQGPAQGQMQDFARQMLSDMPSSERPFGQVVNAETATSTAVSALMDQNTALTTPGAVAPPHFSNQDGDYKSILEAGFTAAQSHSLQTGTHNRDRSGAHGFDQEEGYNRQPGNGQSSATGSYNQGPAPPASSGGGEQGYDVRQLDDIRYGRGTSEITTLATAAKPSRGRRAASGDSKAVQIMRLARTFAFPLLGAVVLLVVFLLVTFNHKEAAPQQPASSSVPSAKALGRFCTADGDKEVRLTSGTEALMISGNLGLKMPYAQITSSWGDLFPAMLSSLSEKQIWAEKKDYGLKTQEEAVYYASDGPESKVIAKMRHLAGYAQAYNLSKGEYPKYVGNMTGEFSFTNPLDNRTSPILIKVLSSQTVDGSDAKGGLEAGLEPGLVASSGPEASMTGNPPCGITCYAVVLDKGQENPEGLRATKFFVRGCDRNGTFLSSGQPGRTYVVPASDTYMAAIPAGAISDSASKPAAGKGKAGRAKLRVKPKTVVKEKSGEGDDADQAESKPKAPAQASTLVIDNPPKNSKLWLIQNPAFPIVLSHHSLPLLMLLLAGLAYLQSRLTHQEATGNSISSTSNTKSKIAMIASWSLLGLAFFTLFVQLVVFG